MRGCENLTEAVVVERRGFLGMISEQCGSAPRSDALATPSPQPPISSTPHLTIRHPSCLIFIFSACLGIWPSRFFWLRDADVPSSHNLGTAPHDGHAFGSNIGSKHSLRCGDGILVPNHAFLHWYKMGTGTTCLLRAAERGRRCYFDVTLSNHIESSI